MNDRKMSGQKVCVLRLGHRRERDKRVTMHVFLTARALSASGVTYSGDKDEDLERRIRAVVDSWGGPFEVTYEANWKKMTEEWKKKGAVCHLTMYGVNVDDCLCRVPRDRDLLVIVGSRKVPREIFELADFNIAIGNQPHSEVAALALFLDRLFEGKAIKKDFKDAKIKVIPRAKGKKLILQSP